MGSGWQGRDGSQLVEIVVKVPHLERKKQVADTISKIEESTCDGMFWQGAT